MKAILNEGDIVDVVVKRKEVYGLFCQFHEYEILVLITDISWIASFCSCEQVADVGDKLRIKITGIDYEHNRIGGSIKQLYPENNPWDGSWNIHEGMTIRAKVKRYVKKADRCEDKPGYFVELKPGSCAMLCDSGKDLRINTLINVIITKIDLNKRAVEIELAEE